jgi:hypothetical protein
MLMLTGALEIHAEATRKVAEPTGKPGGIVKFT